MWPALLSLFLDEMSLTPKQQVQPLRINKATPNVPSRKMPSGIPRPLSELSPTEMRRNSPSWHHTGSPKVRSPQHAFLLIIQSLANAPRRRQVKTSTRHRSSLRPLSLSLHLACSGRTETQISMVEEPDLRVAPPLRNSRKPPVSRTVTFLLLNKSKSMTRRASPRLRGHLQRFKIMSLARLHLSDPRSADVQALGITEAKAKPPYLQ